MICFLKVQVDKKINKKIIKIFNQLKVFGLTDLVIVKIHAPVVGFLCLLHESNISCVCSWFSIEMLLNSGTVHFDA